MVYRLIVRYTGPYSESDAKVPIVTPDWPHKAESGHVSRLCLAWPCLLSETLCHPPSMRTLDMVYCSVLPDMSVTVATSILRFSTTGVDRSHKAETVRGVYRHVDRDFPVPLRYVVPWS